ncbi:MAG: peptidylprolyl isomerase [Maricaulaceae bacterium]
MRAALGFIALVALGLTACSDTSPNVILETSAGNIEIEVYPKKAPLTAADFLYHVDEGLYDNQGFYRVVTPATDPLDMGMALIQGGRLDLVPVTPSVDHEGTVASGLSNVTGSVAMARDAVNTGSAAYFFINMGDNIFLDEGGTRNPDGAGYAVFGTIVSGLDVAKIIQSGSVAATTPLSGTENQFLEAPIVIKRAYRK